MSNKIEIVPTSKVTANMTPFILSQTPRTQTIFEPMQVDNKVDSKMNIKGKLVYKKINKDVGCFDVVKLSKKDIKSNEYVELNLDCEETYNLGKGLFEYFKLTMGKETPYNTQIYVKEDVDIKQLKSILQNNTKLISLLNDSNLDIINIVLNIENLKRTKVLIEKNISHDSNEDLWQILFTENAWVLSQIFATPYVFYKEQPYVGGKGIENSNGKFPDYVYKNELTNNIAIIEIKTPQTKLVSSSEYRKGVYSMSGDFMGAVCQILSQRDVLYKDYIQNNHHSNEKYEALNFNCILIVGNVSELKNEQPVNDKFNSFEIFRNELKNIQVVGFDELLEKIDIMIKLLEVI